jgi:RNA polymerase sigma-70 factor (ECF subfamily)
VTDSAERIYEQVLVARCQTGDEAARAELVRRYHARLVYFVRRLLGDDCPIDDVLQEVWLAALSHLARLRSPAAFRVWLYRIARNQVCTALRRRHQWADLPDDGLAAPADDQPAFTRDQAGLIHVCLGRLKPVHREVLVLRFIEGMTYEQIAEVVGCPVGTVRSRIHHAKSALRHEMEASDDQ